VVAGAGLLLFAPWLAAHTLAAPQLAPLLQAGSALVLCNTLQGVYAGALAGFEAFKRVAQVSWMGAVLGLPFLVAGTFAAGLPGAVWGSVLQIAVGCVIGHLALAKEAAQKNVPLSYAPRRDDCGILWRFSLPAFLSSTLYGPATWLCSTFLANQPQGYKEVALINAASQWRNFLIFVPMTLTSVLAPLFANLYQLGQRAEFEKLLRRNMAINVGICLALCLPLVFFAPSVLDWYGPGFRRGVPVFLLTLSTIAMTAATTLFSRAMQATGRAWIEMTFTAIWALVLIVGCFLLIPAYKAVGFASAQVLAAIVLALWQWQLVRRLFANRELAPA
jgi:O-antigen/teichoic acid export membrane protein